MTNAENPAPPKPTGIPAFLHPIGRFWAGTSPRLIPLLAVISAFILGIPVVMIAKNEPNPIRGLDHAAQAYSALIEGATGLAVNRVITPDDFADLERYAANNELPATGISRLGRPFQRIETLGLETTETYAAFFRDNPDLQALDADTFEDLAARIIGIREADNGDELRAVVGTLRRLQAADLSERDITTLGNAILNDPDTIQTDEELAELWQPLADLEADEQERARADLRYIVENNSVATQRNANAVALLDDLGFELRGEEASHIVDIQAAGLGVVQEAIATLSLVRDNNIEDPTRLSAAFRIMDGLYRAGILDAPTLNEALDNQLPQALEDHLVIVRPGILSNIFIGRGQGSYISGRLYHNNLPIVFVQLPLNRAFVFIPANLESTIVRAIPFIIVGLAVALGFKAGLFNIGAEGQLYAGAILAAWAGYALNGVPSIIHIPFVIFVGILGGFLWGAIPGGLKAFTGAHEVITTIMLNFIAIRLVDWLIKSRNPLLLGDPAASRPQTPNIEQSARMPTFDTFPEWLFILAGLFIFAWLAYPLRAKLSANPRLLLRPVLWALAVTGAGFFFKAIAVNGNLHFGLVMMFFAVWFAGWLLDRTTLGFELRTVGTNPDAARYAGMSVPRNILLAMAISGALAGYAGMIEISAVSYTMTPDFFAGVGFDAIAVALLARTNPRGMLWAGFLWGGLISGGTLMQNRVQISSELIQIIQAIIIMFVAADQIVRFLWRVPKRSKDDELMIKTGWGG